MENKEVREVVKEKNKELGKVKPFSFIHISLKLFFIDSFNKMAQSRNKRALKRKIKKANKQQTSDL